MFILLCTQSISIFIFASNATISVNINSIIQLVWVIFWRVIDMYTINSIVHIHVALIERVFYRLTVRFLLNSVHTIIVLYAGRPTQWIIIQNFPTIIQISFRRPHQFGDLMDSFGIGLIIHGPLEVCTLWCPVVRIGSLELLATSWVKFICCNVSIIGHQIASPIFTLHLVHFEDWLNWNLSRRLLQFFLIFIIFKLLFRLLTALSLTFLECLAFFLFSNYLVRNIYRILCPRITLFTNLIILILVASVDSIVVFLLSKVIWYTKCILNFCSASR